MSEKKICEYNKSIHMSKEADKFHIDKCVMKTMAKMGNKEKCMRYMSGVMNANNSSKMCSIKNIENICEAHKYNFTMDDAIKLCTIKNQATSEFWKEKNMSWQNSKNASESKESSSVSASESKQNINSSVSAPESKPNAIGSASVPSDMKTQQKDWIEKMKEYIPQPNQDGTWLEKSRQL
jgi:hypothetical protein